MKFNKKEVEPPILNKEGSKAYKMDCKEELISRVVTSLVGESKFYTSGKDADEEMLNSIRVVLSQDPEFVLKLAVYARHVMNLRSVPLVLLVEYANATYGITDSRKYVTSVISRVDEITELLALQFRYNDVYGRNNKLPMFIKNGVASAFNKFDEYQFAKYNRDGTVRLKDALYLCHPSPKDQHQQDLFDKISNETLSTPKTWETYISANGSNKVTWEAIIPSMGYMAMMRNLRNFIENNVDVNKYVLPILTDRERVIKSKQLPFRFLSAYKAVEQLKYDSPLQTNRLLNGLSTALQYSVDNVTRIPGSSFIAIDNSASMEWHTSSKTKLTYKDIACLFGSMSSHICDNSIVSVFAEDFNLPRISGNVLEDALALKDINVGGATFAWKILDYLLNKQVIVDRILLFSDMQIYGGSYSRVGGMDFEGLYNKYNHIVNPHVKLYCFDLSGYGTQIMKQNDKSVVNISGWSERVLDFIKMNEVDAGSMIKAIDKIVV